MECLLLPSAESLSGLPRCTEVFLHSDVCLVAKRSNYTCILVAGNASFSFLAMMSGFGSPPQLSLFQEHIMLGFIILLWICKQVSRTPPLIHTLLCQRWAGTIIVMTAILYSFVELCRRPRISSAWQWAHTVLSADCKIVYHVPS